jgi:hypothetical protein
MVLRILGWGLMLWTVYRKTRKKRKAMLVAFSLRKGKPMAGTRNIRRSRVLRAEGHQQR